MSVFGLSNLVMIARQIGGNQAEARPQRVKKLNSVDVVIHLNDNVIS
jgi:hypothetical protein